MLGRFRIRRKGAGIALGAAMQGVIRVTAVAVLFISAGVLAYEAVLPSPDVALPETKAQPKVVSGSVDPKALAAAADRQALIDALAAREQELAELKAKLAETDDSEAYAKAVSLGVTNAVRKSGLTERGMRRLAVAIIRSAEKYGVDPLLICAVIHTESSFNNYAVSGVGAMGLMQVMPDTGKFLLSERGESLNRSTNLFDYELNVELGTSYLADLIQRFGSVEAALVAYNAGPGLAQKILASRSSRVKFMQGYPKKVVSTWKKLQRAQQDVAQK